MRHVGSSFGLQPDLLPATNGGHGPVRVSGAAQGRGHLTSPLSTAAFELTIPSRADIPFLYALATSVETGYRWRYHGRIPPLDKFEAELWQNVLTQFVVRRRASGEPIGQVVCYGPDITNGHAYLGAVFTPQISGSGHPVHIVRLFLKYIFSGWRFHKIYMEVPEGNFEAIQSGRAGFSRLRVA